LKSSEKILVWKLIEVWWLLYQILIVLIHQGRRRQRMLRQFWLKNKTMKLMLIVVLRNQQMRRLR
jgi:hypothetical protein